MSEVGQVLKIRRALLTVSDKTGLIELGRALADSGAELVATGRTASMLVAAGLKVTPIEKVSGSPEAFQGRMKTLSFPVCSGILYRRGDLSDERDLKALNILPIDCVVVNFYPFEAAAAKEGITHEQLIEEVDIGGPTLVRAAAKNAPDVLVLTDPSQYGQVVAQLKVRSGVASEAVHDCARAAWNKILAYDAAICSRLGGADIAASASRAETAGMPPDAAPSSVAGRRALRYGENPHQQGHLEFDPLGPIDWGSSLTPSELSYNNILDLSAAYSLASDLVQLDPHSTGAVIVKHGNPCGVALIPRALPGAQKLALQRAWDGDPVSAFGGVVVFTDAIEAQTSDWLAEHFVELVSAPGLEAKGQALSIMLAKRKNLKAVGIRRFGVLPQGNHTAVPGGVVFQTTDTGLDETLKCVTHKTWPESKLALARFGVAVARSLKSNALSIVREIPEVPGSMQLIGTGQGQPNRVEALEKLAIPRAQAVLLKSGGSLGDAVLVSDAFFPFRDTVDLASASGIRFIVQPGGSIKDAESVTACNEHGVAMAFTGVRHFRH